MGLKNYRNNRLLCLCGYGISMVVGFIWSKSTKIKIDPENNMRDINKTQNCNISVPIILWNALFVFLRFEGSNVHM